ncbi:MAG: adenosylmethionine--8-amino-7-oxononanoate transaminase [Thermoproteota archaeon]|nr:adenosylmethionine--8-amino-7-oxononanoate transaminase [Thermoproteota archaeon]
MRDLEKADKQYIWHPYTQMKEWRNSKNNVITKGSGFFLIDIHGNRYLDGIASMWCNVWGHGQNEVTEAMIEQIRNLQHSTLFGLSNEPSVKLAEKLIKIAKGMDKVFYSDNGSTAVEVALKMALQYYKNIGKPEKKYFITIENGYHGDTAGAMSVGFMKKYFGAYKPLLMNVFRAPGPNRYNKFLGKKIDSIDENIDYCIEKTENLLKKVASKCCALIMESGAQIAGGVVIYPNNYQKKISDLCDKYDILLVLDEIATGFGRLGNMVEYLAQNSSPHIVCFGKALTAGYFPLAVTLTTDRIYNSFLDEFGKNKELYHGHTFTGHPVGCATALANIDLYKRKNLLSQIRDNGNYISNRLRELKSLSYSNIQMDIRHKGLLAGIELETKKGKPLEYLKNKQRLSSFIMKESLKMNVFLRPLGNILVTIPPLAIDRDNLKQIMDVQFELIGMINSKIIT